MKAYITDGTDTVYLKKTTGGPSSYDLVGIDDGYTPLFADVNDDETYADVTETWELLFTSSLDTNRATQLKTLGRLRLKARERESKRLLDSHVWLVAETPTEGGTRYALVKDVPLTELDLRHWRQTSLPRLSVPITREGAWRAQDPTDAWPGALGGTTLENYRAPGASNVLAVTGLPLDGDAPALCRIDLLPQAGNGDSFLVAFGEYDTLAQANGFNSQLLMDDENLQGASHRVADANSPGGTRISHSKGSSGTITYNWDTALGTDEYEGEYLVYAAVQPDNDIALRLVVDDYGTLDTIDLDMSVPSAGDYARVLLGRISIPTRRPAFPGITQPSSHSLKILATWGNGSGTLEMRSLWLVPISHGAVGIRKIQSAAREVFFDGDYEVFYIVDTGSNEQAEITDEEMLGNFFRLKPNKYYAFYFYAWLDNDTDHETWEIDDEARVRVRAIDRYTALRD